MQEMTMVERVAKNIYEGRNGRGCVPWSRRSGGHKAPYLSDARAAIEAMREPTDAMIAEGNAYDECAPYDIYESMIDAALSE